MICTDDQNLLREMNDPSMFCSDDQFPQIPDFPCMSSSSSSSSNFAPTTTSTASSMSRSMLETTDGSGTIDCLDVMENYGYMDLIDGNDVWDPSSIFEQNPPGLQPGSEVVQEDGDGGGGRLDELGSVFFDWLKSNKELISAEDMRKIKIKKSTVECASKKLGSSKEGKKQLLKLILEWVQQHQLQRKNSSGEEAPTRCDISTAGYPLGHFNGLPLPAPPPVWDPRREISDNGICPSQWTSSYPPYMADQTGNGMPMVVPHVQPPSTFSYIGGGGYDSGLNSPLNPYNNTGSGDYSWNPSHITMSRSPFSNQFPDVGNNNYAPQIMPVASSFTDPFSYNPSVYAAGGAGEQRLMGLGQSATKEARKKRMARQRRTYFHHHQHSRHDQNHVSSADHHPMVIDDNSPGQGNWLYWPSPPSTITVPSPPMEAPQQPSSRPHQSGDQRLSKQTSSEGLKSEKNLKFLLQKVLKQSDVGSLGRIVMPKKEAESHLPDLDSRDGITIAMEDIGTSQVWNMRYRFWPNNKSRMYLLENTGEFVKANGLQEGDFIVLYSNVKCGKYLIRGVKVRQPASGKSEGKKPVKRSYRSTT